jgi:hypothetical protein
MRAAYIDTRRREMLNELNSRAPDITVRELLEGVLVPQLELLCEEHGTYYYNRFLAQAALSGQENVREMWREQFGETLAEFGKLTALCLPHIPPQILKQRIAIHTDFNIYGMAGMERVVQKQLEAKKPFALERAISNLIDMLAGALGAPVSDLTEAALAMEVP